MAVLRDILYKVTINKVVGDTSIDNSRMLASGRGDFDARLTSRLD